MQIEIYLEGKSHLCIVDLVKYLTTMYKLLCQDLLSGVNETLSVSF